MSSSRSAAVVGSGPNGLAAAVTLARAGLDVTVHEAADTPGGGLRTKALFDRDVVHDLCAAVHPMAPASRFFRAFDLPARGVRLHVPDVPYAHPLPGGRAALAHRDLDAARRALGPVDGPRWHRLMAPLVAHSTGLTDLILDTGRRLPADPAAALLLAPRVLGHALTRSTGTGTLATPEARALLTGVAAHALGPLPTIPSAAVTMLLGHLAHATGWPVPEGGSARIAEALLKDLADHGGTVRTGSRVDDLRDLADHRAVLLDVSPKEFLRIAGRRLPPGYARALRRFRYGAGAAKVDYLVSEPVPWANPEVGRAPTVHLGGTAEELVRAENAAARGVLPDEPFVLLVDPAVADPGRARAGRRPVWAYAHVPNGDPRDPVDLVTRRIERFAPGFADTVVAARGVSAARMERYNANYVGGDIAAGAMSLRQALARPVPRWDAWRTPLRGVYLCSASTPPGPGVHGMSGHAAALRALRTQFGLRTPPRLGPS